MYRHRAMKPTSLTRREFLERTSSSLAAASFMPPGVSEERNPYASVGNHVGAGRPRGLTIFPEPQEMHLSEGYFILDSKAAALLPNNPTATDVLLARFLVEELSDQYDLQLGTQRTDVLPESGRFILVGSIQNPLVKEQCTRWNLDVGAKTPGSEGYLLRVDERAVLIAGSHDRGAFYGLQSFRQMVERGGRAANSRCATAGLAREAVSRCEALSPGTEQYSVLQALCRRLHGSVQTEHTDGGNERLYAS